MKLDSTICHRRTTELEADAMVNEGGAIRQPSMAASEEAYTHLIEHTARNESSWRAVFHNPTTLFWTGFATGLALSLLEKHPMPDN